MREIVNLCGFSPHSHTYKQGVMMYLKLSTSQGRAKETLTIEDNVHMLYYTKGTTKNMLTANWMRQVPQYNVA